MPVSRFFILLTLCLFSASAFADGHDLASARRFVEEVYCLFESTRGGVLTREAGGQGEVASPEPWALMQESLALTPVDSAPALSGEPLCGCQDFEVLRLRHIEIGEIRGNRTSAKVVFTLREAPPGDPVTVRLMLPWRDGRWHVDDVSWPASLRARLEANIAESRFFLREGESLARRFIADIFAEYRDGAQPDLRRGGANAIAARHLRERLQKLALLGDALDFDPICNCRDYREIRVEHIEVVLLPQRMARVTARFANAAHPAYAMSSTGSLI